MASPPTVDARDTTAWLRRFARTTPGVIGLIAIAVAAGCIICSAVCVAALQTRIAEGRAVLEHSEPLAYAAQNLYVALSAADAAAASGFLASEIQAGPMRARYQEALADAASALSDATAGASDLQTRTAMAEISAQMLTYAGLVEAARANSRQGFAVGSGYLREASSLMQDSLLPAAEKIYTGNLARVDRAQRAVGSVPTVGLSLLAVLLFTVGAGSLLMFARTNRLVNLGLTVAAVATLLMITWLVVATRLAAADIEQSRTDGTQRIAQLGEARILAERARTVETLQLIAHGDVTASDEKFYALIAALEKLIRSAPPPTAHSVANWTGSHRAQVQTYLSGDYPGAVAQAIGADPGASAAQFAAVETGLHDGIQQARAALRDEVSAAQARLAWSPIGALALMAIAVAAAVTGLWPRLKEFL